MKKIFTFLTLSFFGLLLFIPIMLGFHAKFMNHHDMDMSNCVAHCISSEVYTNSSELAVNMNSIIILLVKNIISRIFEFSIPLVLLYVILSRSPPNLLYRIKNYDYSSLVGIVQLRN